MQLCRCCLSSDGYKDISSEYYHEGAKEVYSDLLFDTFCITISYLDTEERLICEECIQKLREATAFRKQVEDAEAAIQRMISSNEPLPQMLKAKSKEADHLCNAQLDDYSWQGENYDGNEECLLEIKSEYEEFSELPAESVSESKPSGHTKLKKITHVAKSTHKEKCKQLLKPLKAKSTEIAQPQLNRRQNSLLLINNSNLCLFDSLKTKFKCFYCKNAYLTILELREHSKIHSDSKYLKKCIFRLQGMSFKNVDISSLACKLCNTQITDLNKLQNHLNETHNIDFSGEENMLIPYRLENGFICVICNDNFNTYYTLSIHMNRHYLNHVCESCGLSFINRLSLRVHINSIHKEQRCTLCNIKFSNNYSRVKHMRTVHDGSESKRYCLLCDKTFRYAYSLNEHKIKVHGAKRQVSQCEECEKYFMSQVNLRTHMRAVHMKERNHHCQFCAKSFFTSCDKRRHEGTHQDGRSFACSFCEGKFKSKDSLRRHLKRQHAQQSQVG